MIKFDIDQAGVSRAHCLIDSDDDDDDDDDDGRDHRFLRFAYNYKPVYTLLILLLVKPM